MQWQVLLLTNSWLSWKQAAGLTSSPIRRVYHTLWFLTLFWICCSVIINKLNSTFGCIYLKYAHHSGSFFLIPLNRGNAVHTKKSTLYCPRYSVPTSLPCLCTVSILSGVCVAVHSAEIHFAAHAAIVWALSHEAQTGKEMLLHCVWAGNLNCFLSLCIKKIEANIINWYETVQAAVGCEHESAR